MRLEVLLAEGPRRRPALDLPLRPVRDEDAAPVQLLKGIPREGAPDIVLAVVALDVLEVGRMVDDVEAEEGDRQLVGWAVALVEGVPGRAAGGAVGLELLNVALK